MRQSGVLQHRHRLSSPYLKQMLTHQHLSNSRLLWHSSLGVAQVLQPQHTRTKIPKVAPNPRVQTRHWWLQLAMHSKQQLQTLRLLMLMLPLRVHQQQAVAIRRPMGLPPRVVLGMSKVSLQGLKQN